MLSGLLKNSSSNSLSVMFSALLESLSSDSMPVMFSALLESLSSDSMPVMFYALLESSSSDSMSKEVSNSNDSEPHSVIVSCSALWRNSSMIFSWPATSRS